MIDGLFIWGVLSGIHSINIVVFWLWYHFVSIVGHLKQESNSSLLTTCIGFPTCFYRTNFGRLDSWHREILHWVGEIARNSRLFVWTIAPDDESRQWAYFAVYGIRHIRDVHSRANKDLNLQKTRWELCWTSRFYKSTNYWWCPFYLYWSSINAPLRINNGPILADFGANALPRHWLVLFAEIN